MNKEDNDKKDISDAQAVKNTEDRRQARDRRGTVDSRVGWAVKDFLFEHGKLIITTAALAIGAWYGLGYQVKANTDTINKNTTSIMTLDDRMMKAEKTDIELHAADQMQLAKLDSISVDIKDLKATVEKLDIKMNDRMTRMSEKTQSQFDEIKKILYKPVIGENTELHNRDMGEVAISVLNK